MEPRELTKEEEQELSKMFPKLPKKKSKIKRIFEAIKNYDKVIKELEFVKKINENRQKDIFRLQSKNKESEDLLVLKVKEIKKLEDKILEKEEQRRSNAGRIGSLTKKANELQEELDLMTKRFEETKKKLEESMTNKYLVKKLPPAKAPKVRMTTKPQKMKPATRKFMAKEFER